jgi:hypothetical protein
MGLSRTWEHEVLSKAFLQPLADFLLQIRCGGKNGPLLHRRIRATTPKIELLHGNENERIAER